MRRRVAAAAVVAALGLALGACGGDDGGDEVVITPEALQAGLIQHEQFTPETAACMSDYLFDAVPPDQLQLLVSDDTSGLPPQFWGRYTQVILTCQYHDELGVPAP